MSASGDLARALEFQFRSIELTTERVTQIDEGWVIRSAAFPEVWSHNQVWVNKPITYADAVGLCRHHLRGAEFWQLYLEHENAGQRLLARLRSGGWEVDTEIHMRLARAPDPVDAAAVIEPAEEESLELMGRWMHEDETLHLSADGIRQMVRKDQLVWRARQARRFGIRAPDGSLAAITQLFSDGPVRQVEHVYTLPEARGRGYARTLVSHAAAQALQGPNELTFIVADDADWPKQLYGRLGFEPLGRTWLLHLPASRVGEGRG